MLFIPYFPVSFISWTQSGDCLRETEGQPHVSTAFAAHSHREMSCAACRPKCSSRHQQQGAANPARMARRDVGAATVFCGWAATDGGRLVHTNTQTDAFALLCIDLSELTRAPSIRTFGRRLTIVCLKTQGNDYFSAMYKVIRFLLLCLVFDLLYIHELLNASATLFLLGRGRPVDNSTDVAANKNVSFSCDSVKCWVTCRLFLLFCFWLCDFYSLTMMFAHESLLFFLHKEAIYVLGSCPMAEGAS